MAELELQINQVMSGLESLAESLGVVVDRMNRLEDMESSYSDTNYSEEHLWRDNVSFEMTKILPVSRAGHLVIHHAHYLI